MGAAGGVVRAVGDAVFMEGIAMSKKLDRCKQLSDCARTIAEGWIPAFADDYRGKVMFCLALGHAVMVMRKITPGLEGTGQDFIDAVKAGTMIWVEAGEPAKAPKEP